MKVASGFLIYAFIFASPAFADNAVHNLGNLPFYIDGNVSTLPQPVLPVKLATQAKNAENLRQALKILGPAYVTAGDTHHISHWHFEDGTMITLWPQGGENPGDAVTIQPRPDCGVPAFLCKDLVLSRKSAAQQSSPSQFKQAQQSMQPYIGQTQRKNGISTSSQQSFTNSIIQKLAPAR